MKRNHAFTIVEMLVVIAIMATLAGLLLPALASAKKRARRAKCLSNLHQVGTSLETYVNNSSDYYPSYHNYGSNSPVVLPSASWKLREYQNRSNYDRLASRFLTIGYTSGRDPSNYVLDRGKPQKNFITTGLGIIVKQKDLPEASVLFCPEMAGTTATFYGHRNGSDVVYEYNIHTNLFDRLRGRTHMQGVEYGDGTWMTAHGPETAVALLSGYSYRLQPWFWVGGSTGDRMTVPWTKPRQRATFLCPPFKTKKEVGLRAILSDCFDYGKYEGWNGQGMASKHHGYGYTVLYSDLHAAWYGDAKKEIMYWDWVTPSDVNIYNDLTISGPEAQEVWHLFDTANEVDI